MVRRMPRKGILTLSASSPGENGGASGVGSGLGKRPVEDGLSKSRGGTFSRPCGGSSSGAGRCGLEAALTSPTVTRPPRPVPST